MTEDTTIKARTKEERVAWVAGFAEAINLVDDHGLESARTFLRLVVGAEVHPTNVPVKEHPGGLG